MKLFWAVVRFVLGLVGVIGGPLFSWEYGFITDTHISPIGLIAGLMIPAVLVFICWFWQPSVLAWPPDRDCNGKPFFRNPG